VVQMLTRQEYIKRIAAADRKNLSRLDQKNQQLTDINRRLRSKRNDKNVKLEAYSQTAAYKEQLIEEEDAEAGLLKKRRNDRESLLERIRDDQDLMRQQLAEKKLAAQRIESLIRSLETRREALPAPPEVTWAPDVPFAQMKGKMNWPTSGKVVTRFGLQRNRQLATVTENPGIEIAAAEDTPVNAVCTGQVTKITWMRGYGNTIIVDHKDGYYTVYAHLGTIVVREGQIVQAGEVIARVGQSGSLEGPRLHFEIWAQRQKQNPLHWLVSR
jgi:septal ring factor EnvC (AmiA/AmiB activator)